MHQSLIEQYNYADAPRPFKNPHYAQKVAGNRRVKTAKQIVQLERERYVKPKKKARVAVGASQAATAAGTPVDGMDVDDEAAQATAEAIVEPAIVRKEEYIACKPGQACLTCIVPFNLHCIKTEMLEPYLTISI
jgi:hypothetical protein